MWCHAGAQRCNKYALWRNCGAKQASRLSQGDLQKPNFVVRYANPPEAASRIKKNEIQFVGQNSCARQVELVEIVSRTALAALKRTDCLQILIVRHHSRRITPDNRVTKEILKCSQALDWRKLFQFKPLESFTLLLISTQLAAAPRRAMPSELIGF